jgi:hypothetical protein
MLAAAEGIVDPVDLYNARGREIAEDRRREAAGPPGVAPSTGRILNSWVMFWAIIGFVVGLLANQNLVGAFVGALTLAGICVAFQLVLRGLGLAVGAGASGLRALNTRLGAIPQWIVFGAIAGAAVGAGIALWLDGNSYDLVGPAMRLAPVGAVAGLLARVVVLVLKRKSAP